MIQLYWNPAPNGWRSKLSVFFVKSKLTGLIIYPGKKDTPPSLTLLRAIKKNNNKFWKSKKGNQRKLDPSTKSAKARPSFDSFIITDEIGKWIKITQNPRSQFDLCFSVTELIRTMNET